MNLTIHHQPASIQNGIRPVNIRTDLRALADLIELVFQDTMDESGRAAIREMRYLSHWNLGLGLISHMNDLASGMSRGYVALQNGDIIANVSLYPANWSKDLGQAWLIANVGTHPNYRRRGIARQLISVCLENLTKKGANHAILQVDYDNYRAIQLYENLGFVRERPFTRWLRSGIASAPRYPTHLENIFLSHPRRHDWQQLYQLVQDSRPNHRGGIGWLRPVTIRDFRPSWHTMFKNVFAISFNEQMIVRNQQDEIKTLLWIKRGLANTRTQLTLFTVPESDPHHAEALLANALRRYRGAGFLIEHPYDDPTTTEILNKYRFRPHRTVWHMRYDF